MKRYMFSIIVISIYGIASRTGIAMADTEIAVKMALEVEAKLNGERIIKCAVMEDVMFRVN